MAKKKTKAVGKTAKAAKTPTPTREHLQHEISHLEHEISRKHDHTKKHHEDHKSKHHDGHKHHHKTGLALVPGDVACCAAQAVAASLRLALGVAVHDEDVLALYWRTAAGPDDGASLLDTLEAAREYGLAGFRPVSFGLTAITPFGCRRSLPSADGPGYRQVYGAVQAPQHGPRYPLILDLELPAPHAVTAGPDGTWWSWGEPYSPASFPGAVLDDAWAVTW